MVVADDVVTCVATEVEVVVGGDAVTVVVAGTVLVNVEVLV
jgi:hypothetical protein